MALNQVAPEQQECFDNSMSPQALSFSICQVEMILFHGVAWRFKQKDKHKQVVHGGCL